ncbi:WecB/TagA/CpsF family glycosyltransferase [Candidatus Peribacteria bacterium]|nr:WecB/TagA/CpsF family glycosyltransferase [Candidatus Peribacteria bacterium]
MVARVFILGVPVDSVTLAEATKRIREMLRSDFQHHILTPNPEMIVAAKFDPEFLSVLQSSSLNVPDGFGLLLASRYLGSALLERVSGVDLLVELCLHADRPVFFLGAAPGVAASAAHVLQKQNAALMIAGTYAGTPDSAEEDAILSRINASGAKLLFVAYGAPVQDLWIARNLKRMPNIRVAMGVGGSFDFLAGIQKRAPVFLQTLGLEWLWRLAQEPRRIGRIFTAVIVFSLLVLFSRRRRGI